MTEQQLKADITHITGLEIDPDLLELSTPDIIENPTGEENVYVIATIPEGLYLNGSIRYEYKRPHYENEWVSLEVGYDDEDQTVGEVVIPFLEHHFGIEGLSEVLKDDRKIKDILNPYSPIMRTEVSAEGYKLTLKCNVVVIPRKMDMKYIFNDVVTDTKESNLILVDERTKDEDTTPLWKQIKTKLDEYFDSIYKQTESNNTEGEDKP